MHFTRRHNSIGQGRAGASFLPASRGIAFPPKERLQDSKAWSRPLLYRKLRNFRARVEAGITVLKRTGPYPPADVSPSTLRDFESGKRVPIADNLAAIRIALEAAGITFLDLVTSQEGWRGVASGGIVACYAGARTGRLYPLRRLLTS